MAEQNEPEQIRLMQHMVDLATKRTDLAEQRTDMARHRTDLAERRTDMARERTVMAERRTTMARDRTRMSAERSEMSAERSYLAAERTLSVWVRTALALMVVGLAIDRFGLMLRRSPAGGALLDTESLSALGGVALVAFGVLMAITTGLRFLAYARTYRVSHIVPYHHGPFLGPLFALLVALFGTALLILLLTLAS